MTERILKKWKQNWLFLLAATAAQAMTALVALVVRACTDLNPLPPPSVLLRLLCWPLLSRLDRLGQDDFGRLDVGLVFLVLFWNAFLWAAVSLELKPMLARFVARHRRAQQ